MCFFFNDTATTEIYTLSLHDALPIYATARVLEAAGYRVQVPADDACCGLTWITTGQLDTARGILGRTVELLAPLVDAGVPVVGVEPSCTAVLRSDAVELVGGPAAERVARGTRTLAEQ